MNNHLYVLLEDNVAGSLTRSRGGNLHFEYDDAYLGQRDPTPLSLSMSIKIKNHTARTVTPWLWGLLPDNEAVLRRWATTFQVSASSPFSLLSTPIGEDCAGAVRLVDSDHLEGALTRGGTIEWLSEADVAARLRDLRADATSWLGRDLSGRFSLAGAQAKTALLHDERGWGIPEGANATTHILKPAIAGLDDHDLNEHLCLRAARLCGLNCAATEVASFEDQQAVVVERYDRLKQPDGSYRRLHQEDLCQALGYSPGLKYQSEGGPDSHQIAELLSTSIAGPEARQDVQRFADALIFNWLIGGTDAHAKNYSILLSGSQVRLAPLYDIGSALVYPDMHVRKLRLAMKFGGSYTLLARDRTMWPKAASELGLPQEALVERAQVLIGQVAEAFSMVANERRVKELRSPLPGRLVDAVAARAEQCQATLS